MGTLLNLWAWTESIALVAIGTPLMAVLYLLTVPFDRGRYVVGRFFRLLAVTSVKLNPLWRFSYGGQLVADPRRPYVVVANHESYADIFLISHLPWEMKWIVKHALFRIPCFGWMMQMAGDIKLRRGERTSIVRAMQDARDRLDRKVSVMLFPEGTRSRDGEMLPFKDGAFRLAIEAQVPVLPLAVAGTRRAMAKGTFRFLPATARVQVLAPIETAGMTLDDIGVLREEVRAAITRGRDALRAELAGA